MSKNRYWDRHRRASYSGPKPIHREPSPVVDMRVTILADCTATAEGAWSRQVKLTAGQVVEYCGVVPNGTVMIRVKGVRCTVVHEAIVYPEGWES